MGKRFPSLVMLEPFVFRRDDEDSFPDDTIRASATTSWGTRFSIAFHIAEPPSISRLYAQLPDSVVREPLGILATHRHLALFRVSTLTPEDRTVQNFFIYRAGHKNPAASSSSLKALPPCTEPDFDTMRRRDGRLPRRNRRAPTSSSDPRLLTHRSMGLWCRGKGDEFVVAELNLLRISDSKVLADICFLRSSLTSADGDQLGGTWDSKRVDILCRDHNPDQLLDIKPYDDLDDMDFKFIDTDAWQLYCWSTDAIIPCDRCLCWIDYHRGILFCDLSSKAKDPTPTVSFLRFPLQEFPSTAICSTFSFLYRGVSVVDDGRALKFIDVARDDGIAYGALKPGASFSITCHTLDLRGDAMGWKWNPAADYKITSSELWNHKYPGCLPRDILMYPQVDIDRPSVVHFLLSDFGHVNSKKMWVVSIDMSKKVLDTCSPINGNEDNADWIKNKFMNPTRFLPCEFPKFLNKSKRKHMG